MSKGNVRNQRLFSTPQVQSQSPEFYVTLTRALVSEGQMQVHTMYWKARLCMSNRRGRGHVHTCPISGKGHTYNRWANKNLTDVLTLSNLNITLCVDLQEQGWESSVWEHPYTPESINQYYLEEMTVVEQNHKPFSRLTSSKITIRKRLARVRQSKIWFWYNSAVNYKYHFTLVFMSNFHWSFALSQSSW